MSFLTFIQLIITAAIFVTRANHTDALESNITVHCPTWYYPSEHDLGKCKCGSTVGGKVRCLSDDKVGLVAGDCMTYTDNQVVVGLCHYAPSNASTLDSLYTTMPMNATDLDDFMCGGLNRTGLMCSKCREGLTLAALSYQMECTQCSSTEKGLVIFICLTLMPTTVFFLIVMLCNINIRSIRTYECCPGHHSNLFSNS